MRLIIGSTLLGLLLLGIVLTITLNPILTYDDKTIHGDFTIYHNRPVDPQLTAVLEKAEGLLKKSAFYKGNLNTDICLNDGSNYPKAIRMLLGPAFAWTIYDKVVLQGEMDCTENIAELNGYKWNLIQLLAHEMTHRLQYDELGFRKSNPIARIPDWKWEGYAEYVSRQGIQQRELGKNMERLNNEVKSSWGIRFEDNTIVPRELYEYWIMVQYCLDIKQMTYPQLLSDPKDELTIKKEMRNWYIKKNL